MKMPNFMIIGAAKAGTTALYKYLEEHPQIFMSPQKEPRFFALEGEKIDFRGPGAMTRFRYVTDIETYRLLFKNVSNELAIGEASTWYLYIPKAAKGIRHYLPNVKLIVMLRDPVQRAYSNFLGLRREGVEPLEDFTEAMVAEKERSFITQTKNFVKNRGQFFRELYFRNRDRLFQEGNYFIAVSEFIRSQLIEKGCSPEKTQVNYIGVDVDKFTPNPLVKREPIVLFVGRLIEKKGCEYLIEAIAKVQKTIPNIELVVIGDGILRSSLENLANNLLSNYRFLGVKPQETVQEWMNKAFLLGAPSVTTATGESEGLPIVILEAQAMGLPVIRLS